MEFIVNGHEFVEVIPHNLVNTTRTSYRLLSTLICIMSDQDWICSLASSTPSCYCLRARCTGGGKLTCTLIPHNTYVTCTAQIMLIILNDKQTFYPFCNLLKPVLALELLVSISMYLLVLAFQVLTCNASANIGLNKL